MGRDWDRITYGNFMPHTFKHTLRTITMATRRLIRPLVGRYVRYGYSTIIHCKTRKRSMSSWTLSSGPSFKNYTDEKDHEHPLGSHLVDVTDLATRMRDEVRSYTQQCPEEVRLVGVMAHNGLERADAEEYSARISETFAEDGIQYEVCRCKGEEPADVEAAVRALNDRPDVHGILIFYPIFKRLEKEKGPYLNRITGVHYKTHDESLGDRVAPEKDVEALSRDKNARHLFRARATDRTQNEVYIPCTALAVNQILETYHQFDLQGPDRWRGVTVTVVNRSEIFGRPLAALLALKGATVYSVNDKSILLFMAGGRMRRCTGLTLDDCLHHSSIVVTGVPGSHFRLPSQSIAPGSTVVDVSEFSNVCESTILDRPNIKLIPHVGKVTVAALEQNLIRLHQRALLNKTN
jgi:methylenetetrahydrofolate dehydrogenase (NAD+)